MKHSKYRTGKIKKSHVDLDELDFDFAVDTAGSWDGVFPEIDKGDYIVTIGCVDNEPQQVLVSRRYTSAIDHENAADLALSAFAERHDYETDDEGEVLEVTNDMGTGIPCWVEEVEEVTK